MAFASAGCGNSVGPADAASDAGIVHVSCAKGGVVDLLGDLTDYYQCQGSNRKWVCVARSPAGRWYDVTGPVNAAGESAGLGSRCGHRRP
jgi:hypothetical protein